MAPLQPEPLSIESRHWAVLLHLTTMAALLAIAGCGSVQQGSPTPDRGSVPVIELVTLRTACPTRQEALTDEPVRLQVVETPVRPEAIGYWERSCPPGEPRQHLEPGLEAFVYDGAFVTTLVSPPEGFIPRPPLIRVSRGEPALRLESRWQGDVLAARLPDGRWYEVGRYQDGRFVAQPRGTTVGYDRMTLLPWHESHRHLNSPREPHDYEAEARRQERQSRVFRQLSEAIRPCVVAAGRLEGSIEVRLDAGGRLADEAQVTSEDDVFSRCCAAALSAFVVEGHSGPASESFRFDFLIDG